MPQEVISAHYTGAYLNQDLQTRIMLPPPQNSRLPRFEIIPINSEHSKYMMDVNL